MHKFNSENKKNKDLWRYDFLVFVLLLSSVSLRLRHFVSYTPLFVSTSKHSPYVQSSSSSPQTVDSTSNVLTSLKKSTNLLKKNFTYKHRPNRQKRYKQKKTSKLLHSSSSKKIIVILLIKNKSLLCYPYTII